MKFQFKEGQWFDVRKLTDWQKQWCLENLEFLTLSTSDFSAEHFSFWLYQEWKNLGHYFGSASQPYIHPENEITFNDFYWEDEEVPQESIFDKPRWVTLKHPVPKLTQGKDYKVVGFIGDGNLLKFTVVDDDECESNTHFSLFHKVTPQDLLPKEVEDSFDNLEFIKPDLGQFNHWMIRLEHLSKEQLDFISTYWKTDVRFKPDRSDQNVVMSMNEGYDSNFVWTNNTNNFMPDSRSHYFSFNQLFKGVN
uniref:Uncharacterized protein n=1 Tax=Vibrio phage P018-4 TaxID=3229728 RepID=A0AB39AJM5_9CAUD